MPCFHESLKSHPMRAMGCLHLHGKSFSCVGSPRSIYVNAGPKNSPVAFSVLCFLASSQTDPHQSRRGQSLGFSSVFRPFVLSTPWAPAQSRLPEERTNNLFTQGHYAEEFSLLGTPPLRGPALVARKPFSTTAKKSN